MPGSKTTALANTTTDPASTQGGEATKNPMTPNKYICRDPSQYRPDAAFPVSHQHSTTSYSCDVSLTMARSRVISGYEASYQIDYQAFECGSEDGDDYYGDGQQKTERVRLIDFAAKACCADQASMCNRTGASTTTASPEPAATSATPVVWTTAALPNRTTLTTQATTPTPSAVAPLPPVSTGTKSTAAPTRRRDQTPGQPLRAPPPPKVEPSSPPDPAVTTATVAAPPPCPAPADPPAPKPPAVARTETVTAAAAVATTNTVTPEPGDSSSGSGAWAVVGGIVAAFVCLICAVGAGTVIELGPCGAKPS